jgi:hypothetical protein
MKPEQQLVVNEMYGLLCSCNTFDVFEGKLKTLILIERIAVSSAMLTELMKKRFPFEFLEKDKIHIGFSVGLMIGNHN